MTWTERIRSRLVDPGVRRWLIAGGAVLILHVGVLSVLPPNPSLELYQHAVTRTVEPIYLDLTPNARPAQTAQEPSDAATSDRAADQPAVAVRTARLAPVPETVAPLVVDTAPPDVRLQRPGRVIPRSWRERCNLGDGEVSDLAWRACRDSVVNGARSTSPPARRRGDPAQDFAAQGAARIAAYEAQRAPAPTGSGNARSSATPGSNFGMGEIDRSVVYGVGQRPVVNGGVD